MALERNVQQKYPVHSKISAIGKISKPGWGEFETILEKGVTEALSIQWEAQVRKK